MLQLTKSRSQDQKALATFDKRVVDQTQLAGVYERWIGIVAAKQRDGSESRATRDRNHLGDRVNWSIF